MHNGVGLVGRTLGPIGMGNIGSELFCLACPLDMRFIAHFRHMFVLRAVLPIASNCCIRILRVLLGIQMEHRR